MSDESMWRAVHRMDEAAADARRSAESMDESVKRLAYLLEPGYGGNGLRLIELLEQMPPVEAPAIRHRRCSRTRDQ